MKNGINQTINETIIPQLIEWRKEKRTFLMIIETGDNMFMSIGGSCRLMRQSLYDLMQRNNLFAEAMIDVVGEFLSNSKKKKTVVMK